MFFEAQGKKKAITFSYDDGVTQDIRLIDLLNKYGLKATFNLNSQLLSQRGILLRGDGRRISHYKIHPEDVAYVYEGHEIAAHTLTHPNLTQCDDREVIRQVEEDRLRLSELAGYEVLGMAYPCGGVNYDDRVVDLIKAHTGIRYSRTTEDNACFDPQEDLLRFRPTVHYAHFRKAMALADAFLEQRTESPQVFYIWGHSYEMDFALNWEQLEEFFKRISFHEDVFYGTNREILL